MARTHRLTGRAAGVRALLVLSLALTVTALSGCGRTVVHARSAPPLSGSTPGAALCGRTGQATAAIMPLPASLVAAILTRSHVTPNPWAAVPPSTVVYACLTPASKGTSGTFVDADGTSTPIPGQGFAGVAVRCAPPSSPTTGAEASPFAGCSFQLGGAASPSGFSSSNKVAAVAIAALLILGAAIWLLLSRRNRRARAAHRPDSA